MSDPMSDPLVLVIHLLIGWLTAGLMYLWGRHDGRKSKDAKND